MKGENIQRSTVPTSAQTAWGEAKVSRRRGASLLVWLEFEFLLQVFIVLLYIYAV